MPKGAGGSEGVPEAPQVVQRVYGSAVSIGCFSLEDVCHEV